MYVHYHRYLQTVNITEVNQVCTECKIKQEACMSNKEGPLSDLRQSCGQYPQ